MINRRHAMLLPSVLIGPRIARAAPPWRIVTEYPDTAISGEGITTFAAALTRLSHGAIAIEPGFDAPDGLKSAGMLQAVAEGRAAAADAFTGALAGTAPLFQLSALPFLTTSGADTARLLQAAQPAYRAELDRRGLTLLYATPWPATGLWSRRPLADGTGLQGLRVRTYDAASTSVFAAAGADPALLSFSDALPRLRSGLLDAVLSSGDGGAGARLWELLPHFTVLDYASPLSLAFCNTAALRALPEHEQAAVEQAARETEARQFATVATRTGANERMMRQNGVTIAAGHAVRGALLPHAAPVIAAWETRAGPEGAAILAAYRR